MISISARRTMALGNWPVRQDEFTDAKVEPAADAARRYWVRRLFRMAWTGGDVAPLVPLLAVSDLQAQAALRSPYFGAAWADLELQSPLLRRRRVRFCDLPAEIAAAESLLQRINTTETLAAD